MNPMKKYLLCAAAMLPLTAGAAYAGNSQTGEGWYTTLSGDLTWLRHSDTGGGGNVALGYQFAQNPWGDWRAEAEVGYHAAPGENGAGDTSYFTYMANLYYDFNNVNTASQWSIAPYVGAGIGDATVHFGESGVNGFNHTFNSFSEHDNVFAYQFMAGLKFVPQSSPNIDWLLGYRYLGSDRSTYLDNGGNSGSDRLGSNNVELAFQFHF